jgi:uncharacterized protein (DUF697 family)
LARIGKRAIVVLNKTDLYQPDEIKAIEATLTRRLRDVLDPVTVVTCAAAPAPITVRDESGRAARETPSPDIGHVADAIARILKSEGKTLLANNILLQAHRVSEAARDLVHEQRREKARAIVTRFQWTSAAVLFVNPVPGLGALAATAINYQLIMEIAKVFGVSLDAPAAKRMAGELAQVLIKMGLVSAAANLLGKALKATVVGYVAGGAIEAVTGAYLTRVSGDAFIDYFAHGQDWGEGGMQGAIEERFRLVGSQDFITSFIEEATRRVLASGSPGSGEVKGDPEQSREGSD